MTGRGEEAQPGRAALAARPGLEGTDLVVTVETALDVATVAEYWELYLETFGPLGVLSVSRQVLHRDEFDEEMQDPRVLKYVARTPEGRVVGLTTLTRDLATVPWISPAWFAHHYPEQAARDAVFYLGFTLVHPDHRRSRAFAAMLDEIGDVVAGCDGVMGWDICAFNDQRGFGRLAARALARSGEVAVVEADRQTYYTGVFAPGEPTSGRPASWEEAAPGKMGTW